MGIPKFYRSLCERYPLVNVPVVAAAVPVFDALYLDMNGIIHNCTHGDDPTLNLTEPEMIQQIFDYLDNLVQIVKPQQLLYMAVDGVAPRANTNGQRQGSFRGARVIEENIAAAAQQGEPCPEGEQFDRNCITPGTAFMERLKSHLLSFVEKKVAEDPVWQQPEVIFSGHNVPGEGEHKIMDYIRSEKCRAGHASNLRHCLYGEDADLIMLALVTHEPHFCILREVVNFSGGGNRRPVREILKDPGAENFVLLQIGVLRDYLELEFRPAPGVLPFKFDLERIIDDFVLLTMLLGNDFLPLLPTLKIAEGALDIMFSMYKKLLPGLGGYLNNAGQLHCGRLQLLLDRIAADSELVTLEMRIKGSARKMGWMGGWGDGSWLPSPGPPPRRPAEPLANDPDESGGVTDAAIDALACGLGAAHALGAQEGPVEMPEKPAEPFEMARAARELMFSGRSKARLQDFKDTYYREKLKLSPEDGAGRRAVVEEYVRGLHWMLGYYYRGLPSWTWYYPYHYAPMVSDITDIANVDATLHYGKPLQPFEQLLATLPSTCHTLLPAPFKALMTESSSPIADFYSTDFHIDREGTHNEWEGVTLVPFIDEARLLQAARSIDPERLTAEERARNTPGEPVIFAHQPVA